MNTLPQFKSDLIAGMDIRRESAQSLVEAVNPDLNVHDNSEWTAKDLIAHLTAFEEDMVDAIQAFMEDEKYRLDLRGVTNIDDFNEMRRLERADKTWEQVIKEWKSARDQLRGLIIAFPTDQLDIPFTTPFMQKYTLMQAIKGCGIHEKMHITEIKKALETSQ